MESVIEKMLVPAEWDRSGLPPWTYHNEDLTDVEKDILFRRHWQLAGHVSDLPGPGSYITLDVAGDRAIVMRGADGTVRAFHNLCRHRGSRVLSDGQGQCKNVIVCPFHGWTYNLDGSLRGPYLPKSFPELNKADYGLKPIETDIWMGFVFLRFLPGPQAPLSQVLSRHDAEVAGYETATMVPAQESFWSQEIAVNWKAVRDVDNEGYHVPRAHPSLRDLYGPNYFDEPMTEGSSRSFAEFTEDRGGTWSVRAYKNILPDRPNLPRSNRRAWLYIGIFPNTVIGLYPDSMMFYQEFPLSARRTVQRGAGYRYQDESRALRLSRYLSTRIDRATAVEDTQLIQWTCEAMESSAFDGILLSDREYGVRSYHDELRAKLPILNLIEPPEAGRAGARNLEMLSDMHVAVAE